MCVCCFALFKGTQKEHRTPLFGGTTPNKKAHTHTPGFSGYRRNPQHQHTCRGACFLESDPPFSVPGEYIGLSQKRYMGLPKLVETRLKAPHKYTFVGWVFLNIRIGQLQRLVSLWLHYFRLKAGVSCVKVPLKGLLQREAKGQDIIYVSQIRIRSLKWLVSSCFDMGHTHHTTRTWGLLTKTPCQVGA